MYARHKQYLTIAESIKRKLSCKETALGRLLCLDESLPFFAHEVLYSAFKQKNDVPSCIEFRFLANLLYFAGICRLVKLQLAQLNLLHCCQRASGR